MSRISRHPLRCIILSTTTRNILLTVVASLVVAVHSARDILMKPVPMPKFLPSLQNVTVRQGGVAVLPCSVQYLGTKQVAWRRIEEDRFLTIGKMTWAEDNHISLEYSRMQGHVSNWNLVIKHVKPKDEGIYECQVTSRAGHVKLVQLNVVGPPISEPDTDSSLLSRVSSTHSLPANVPNLPVTVCVEADEKGCLISITGRKYVDLGDKIHLKCNASSGVRVADEMDWFKAGDKIDSGKYSHVIIEKYKSMETRSFISILIIERSSLADTGDYICRSSRNDIASLKVTVLHAGTENKRRGTETDRTKSPYHSIDGDKDNNSSNSLFRSTNMFLSVLCALCAVAHRWTMNLNPHPVNS